MRPAIYFALMAAMTLQVRTIRVATANESALPVRAVVTVPEATLRSGPGAEFHATGVLPRNTTVVVCQQDGGGWLGVRPTEASFSWVFGRHVNVLADGSGHINKDDVPIRVGGRLDDPRHVIQTRLRKNDQVKILGEELSSGQRWFKIAPPSGERRWVHIDDVEILRGLGDSNTELADHPVEPIRPTDLAIDQFALRGPTPKSEETAESTDAEAAEIVKRPDGTSVCDPVHLVPETSASAVSTGWVNSSGWVTSASHEESLENEVAANETSALDQSDSREFDADFAKTILAVDLRLSETIAGNRNGWELQVLENDAEALLRTAVTVAEREAAKRLLQKIDRFTSIQRRSERMAAAQPTSSTLTTSPPSLPATTLFAPPVGPSPVPTAYSPLPPFTTSPQTIPQQPAEGRALFGPRPSSSSFEQARDGTRRHDAVGELRPVVSRQTGAPRYALVDTTGRIVTFVTPTPDVDIHEFLGQRVGVSGPREFLPEFRQTHVTAGRVIPLLAPLRR